MKNRTFDGLALLATLTLLGGCASTASYAPGCMALGGDTIEITGDRYTWDKFTDAVRVDSDGKAIDPFPDHPRRGRVQRDRGTWQFLDGDGKPVLTRYHHEADGQHYLLTARERDQVARGEAPPRCSLTRKLP